MTPDELYKTLRQRPGVIALRARLDAMSPAARKAAISITANRLRHLLEQRQYRQSLHGKSKTEVAGESMVTSEKKGRYRVNWSGPRVTAG